LVVSDSYMAVVKGLIRCGFIDLKRL